MSNPKELYINSSRCYTSALASIYSPIQEEIKDKDLLPFYSIWGIPFVPFLDGGDATLAFFAKMRKLSPTQGAVINSILKYSFGGDISVIAKDDGFEGEPRELGSQEKVRYIDWIKSFTNANHIIQTERKLGESLKTFGNAYLEVVKTRVAGDNFFYFYAIAGDRVRYIYSSDNEPKAAFISPEWTQYYINKYPPRATAVYPNWEIEDDGTERTLIHIKNETIERDWYGEPDSIMCLYYQFLEYQQGRYTTEGYANDWTARVFIETVGDVEDLEGKKAFDNAILNTFSNKGKGSKVLHRQRGLDMPQSFVHDFPNNTNENFHKTMGEIAEDQIIKAHDWHPILFRKTQGSMGNSQEFMNVFAVKNLSVIKPLQDAVLYPLRKALDIAAEWLGFDAGDVTIGCTSPYQLWIEQQKESMQAQEQPQATVTTQNPA